MSATTVFAVIVVTTVLGDFGGVVANSFDLCGHEVIRAENGTVSFGSSSLKADKAPFECRRIIRVSSGGRVNLAVNKRSIDSEDVFTVYDGATTDFEILPLNPKEQNTLYETSGNTMLLVFKGLKSNKDAPSRQIQANFSATAFQESCKCRGVFNGFLVCNESISDRKCALNCTDGSVNLFPSSKPFTCDLKTGKWNRSVHSESVTCQKASIPATVKISLNLTYGFSNCTKYNSSFIRKQLEGVLKADSNIIITGQCFKNVSSEGPKATCDGFNPLSISCQGNDSHSVITVVIQDTIANATKEQFQALNATYVEGLSIVTLRANLVIVSRNETYAVNKTSKGHVKPVCLDGQFYIAKSVAHPVCSKCPKGHYYDAAALGCNKCPPGEHTPEGATSCTPLGGALPLVPLRKTCENKCMKGKEVDTKKGHCQWCPEDSFQSSDDVLNPKCSPCPDGKKTPLTGAKSSGECYTPCSKGKYFNVASSQCQLCPLGTFMDQTAHMITGCQTCDRNKVTSLSGSTDQKDCIKACAVGHFYDSQTSNCRPCAAGSYQDKVNQNSCTNCTAGQSTIGAASTSSDDCIQKCLKGTFLDRDNGNACKSCPKGTYQDIQGHLGTSCKKCGSDKSTSKEGAIDASECAYTCVAGQQYSAKDSKCVGCAIGFYQSIAGQENCIQCPSGMSTLTVNQTSKEDCVTLCNQGEYFSNVTNTCSPCPVGKYQSAKEHLRTSCQPCPSKVTAVKGATNRGACLSVCSSNPCKGGAECTESEDSYACKCPQGFTGKLCDVIADADKLERVTTSLRFTGLEWNEQLGDQSSAVYKKTRKQIEMAVRQALADDPSVKAVKVTNMRQGSVVAEFDLYMDSSNASLVPAKSLQTAAARGSVGSLPVDSTSLRILQQSCRRALGMESGRISDEQITASSSSGSKPSQARLHDGTGWTANGLGHNEFLQIKFPRPVNITGLVTQGASGAHVTVFTISYSSEEGAWIEYNKNFIANNDSDSEVTNKIQPPISNVRYIRVTAVSWSTRIAMRMELYGCATDPVLSPDEMPTQPPTTEPPTTEPGTTTGPNVGASARKDDDEYAWGKYLGIAFGILMVAGVVIAAFFWCRSSRRKREEREQSPLVMTRFQDSNYRVIEDKNADDDEEEAIV